MIRRVCLAATCALMIVLGGCDLFGDSESPKTLAGSWRGMVTTQDSSYTLTLNLRQAPEAGEQGPVAGTGRLATEGTTREFSVSGTFTNPPLSLSLRFQQARPAQLQGRIDEALETIEADLFGGPASFNGASVTLERN